MSLDNYNNKRKRRPAGTPDPDAEVLSLSPRTLLESDRYVCDICNQGFQRDQNLQMHRRRHKVPWKLLKREKADANKKRVFVCPEPSCLHHDPCHALGDLVGIKKHFRRKHSDHKQWVCGRCNKAYAVQSDYKAHLKTCGTHGHSCDCGKVFSRVESFIEHQDSRHTGRTRPQIQPPQSVCLSRTTPTSTPSSETNLSGGAATWHGSIRLPPGMVGVAPPFLHFNQSTPSPQSREATKRSSRGAELQLLPTSFNSVALKDDHFRGNSISSWVTPLEQPISSIAPEEVNATQLQLTIGLSSVYKDQAEERNVREQIQEVEEVRKQAKKQIELAEEEFANAKRLRLQAQLEIRRAQMLRNHAVKQINASLLEVTCHLCKHKYMQVAAAMIEDNNSLATASYVSSAVTEEEGENDNHRNQYLHHKLTSTHT